MTQANMNNWHLAHSSEGVKSDLSRQRAIHFGVAEAAPRVTLKKLPADFAERVREVMILGTPGLDEGLEHSDKVIDDWKKSL